MVDSLRLSVLRRRLEEDLASTDLLWSFMVAALSSYRYDTVLWPFPVMYLKPSEDGRVNGSGGEITANGRNSFRPLAENRDYVALRNDVAQCPNFKSANLSFDGNDRLLELVLWTISGKQFSLKLCDSEKFYDIRSLTGHTIDVAAPDYIFEVGYGPAADEKFNSLRNDRALIYAYHGSRLENFHSILHYGLQGHLNKNSVFGEGTYLSSELSVSIQYSPMGLGWEKSVLGSQLSCVAICEIIDDPSVKCKLHDRQNVAGTRSPNSRARIANSIGGDVPEKYYVVRNNDVMRVKYLLVYAQKNCLQRRTWRWLQKYKFILILAIYVILLIVLGLYRSVTIRSYARRFLNT